MKKIKMLQTHQQRIMNEFNKFVDLYKRTKSIIDYSKIEVTYTQLLDKNNIPIFNNFEENSDLTH